MENKFGNTSPVGREISGVADTESRTTDKMAAKAPLTVFGAAKVLVPNMIAAGELLAEALGQFGFAEAALALRIGIWILRLLTSRAGVKALSTVIRSARRLGVGLAWLARGGARMLARLAHAAHHGIWLLVCRSHLGWRRLHTLVRRLRLR